MVGLEARVEGYVKDIMMGETGDIITTSIGGGSDAYWCDSHLTLVTASSIRSLFLGGSSYNTSTAGLLWARTTYNPSFSSAVVGTRLCFIPTNV